jgi:hypothetical protein
MTERTRAIKQYNRRAAAGLHDDPYCGCISGLVDKLAATIKHSEDLWYKDGCLDGQDDVRRDKLTEQLTIAFRGRIRFSAGIELTDDETCGIIATRNHVGHAGNTLTSYDVIKRTPDAPLDWASQEDAIAAALSGDPNLVKRAPDAPLHGRPPTPEI